MVLTRCLKKAVNLLNNTTDVAIFRVLARSGLEPRGACAVAGRGNPCIDSRPRGDRGLPERRRWIASFLAMTGLFGALARSRHWRAHNARSLDGWLCL
jgi:hypothetical protein